MLGLLCTFALIALNGFFVAAEFALVKLRATRGAYPGKHGRAHKHVMLAHVVDKLDVYLGVTQLGVTLASLGLGWIGEPALASLTDRAFVAITGHSSGPHSSTAVLVIAFCLLTVLHILFGELIPKLIAIQRSRDAALIAVPVLRVIKFVMYPALWLLDRVSRGVLTLIGLPFDAFNEGALSQEEIVGILAANVARGPGGAAKQELLRRVVRFSQRTARSAMIPRVDIAALPVGTPGDAAMEYLRQQRYSRLLLLKGTSLDEVIGYVHAKDLLFNKDAHSLADLSSVKRDVLFIPETQELVSALERMQSSQVMLAVIVDEYGGTSGIITMEDLVEEIVGEIQDEFDEEAARIERKEDSWEVDGRVFLDELREAGVEAEEGDLHQSVGALVTDHLDRLPRVGDAITVAGILFEVLAVARRRVVRVRISRATP